MNQMVVGKYKILNQIGRGGMGVVYLGEQLYLKRLVAIKTLPAELAHDREYLVRIENEARILAKFSHPCIVNIHDVEVQDDIVFLIMEYVQGWTVLDRLKKSGPYSIDEAAHIVIRVASALDHAHQKGIIHRDIKPSNIMIREDNAVKVTDFGIAKSSEGLDITRMRFIPGTRSYMSPEQAVGNRDMDGRSDIYSLGIVFFQMITGKLPSLPLEDHLEHVPPPYAHIIIRCLEQDPSHRYASAAELIESLGEARAKASEPPAPQKRRPFSAVYLFVLGALGFIVFGVMLIRHLERSDAPPGLLQTKPSVARPEVDARPLSGLKSHAVALRSPREMEQALVEGISSLASDPDRTSVRKALCMPVGIEAKNLRGVASLAILERYLNRIECVEIVKDRACDLLLVLDSGAETSTLMILSSFFTEAKHESFHELYEFKDEQWLAASLESIVNRYYCFRVLRSIERLYPPAVGDELDLAVEGGTDGKIQVGKALEICMVPKFRSHAVLLSLNAEGVFLLYPRTRDEHALLNPDLARCTEPITVAPPTGIELIWSLLIRDKALLSIDRYLAEEDQVVIEPVVWSYDALKPDNSIELCERFFITLYKAPNGSFASKSRFIRSIEK